MDRPQSEGRICSVRDMRLLTAANFEARLRDGEASPDTAPRETRALLPVEEESTATTTRRAFYLPHFEDLHFAKKGSSPTFSLHFE